MLLWMVRLLLLLLLLVEVTLLLHLLELHLLLPKIVLVVEAHQELLRLDELGVIWRGVVLFHLLKFLEALLIQCHVTKQ